MQLRGSPGISTLVDQAIAIVMEENACDAGMAVSTLAGLAATHQLPLEEIAAAVVAVHQAAVVAA